jgi:DNA-binding NarL/FixJ family response regulator
MSTSYSCADELAVVQDLSRRQIRVLALMVTTRSDEKIAARLRCSLRTVRSDIAQVLSFLDVPTRFAAGVRIAELLGGPAGWPVAS